jgi:hypothetical protein
MVTNIVDCDFDRLQGDRRRTAIADVHAGLTSIKPV